MLWTDWLSFTKGKLSAFRDVKDHEKLYQEAALALEEAVGQIIGYPPSAAPTHVKVLVLLAGSGEMQFAEKHTNGLWFVESIGEDNMRTDEDIAAWWNLPSYVKS